MATFSHEEIKAGLKRLGELAHAKGLHIRLTLVGGAVMVLQFNARLSTHDVDAVILLRAKPALFVNWQNRLPANSIGQTIG